jgi:crossover junction endodeoxyribonuclease RuvC
MAAADKILILGVDPGLQQTGLGLIAVDGQRIALRASRLLTTKTSELLPARLRTLFRGMQETLREWRPHIIVVEKLIYARNAQIALKLGHARGVLLLAGELNNVAIAEYTPAEIKRAVTGNGSASKEQVHRMVKVIVGSQELSSSFDVTDALALAICHAHRAAHNKTSEKPATSRFQKRLKKRSGARSAAGTTFLARA